MKKLLYIYAVGALLFASCTKDFEAINTNPNAPIEVQPSLLLRQVIYDYGEQMSYEGFTAGNPLGQYMTMVDFNLFDRHSLTQPQYGGNPWPVVYKNLRDNELLLNASRENPAQAVYEGPALIMKAYMAQALTDMYGDVPYFEALQGKSGNVSPVYDRQEDIYLAENGILDNLNRGIEAIENYTGAASLDGDILFNGASQGWLRFANSLKIKALMRISAKHDVSTELQAIVDAGVYIKTNAENATYDFTDNQPNNFRMASLRQGDFNIYVMSATMDQIMDRYLDPRVSVFFRKSANDTYKGLLNGQDASQSSITVSNYSFAGTSFRESTGDLDANFITAWETQFWLAEAALKGYISDNAQTFYESGVELAFEYWMTDLPESYLTLDSAAYGAFGQDPMAQIITQKWIANTINGYEGWIEYNRTGFPKFKTLAASLNNGLIPSRLPYPTDEQALNATNFDAAAANTNGNNVNAKMWWQP